MKYYVIPFVMSDKNYFAFANQVESGSDSIERFEITFEPNKNFINAKLLILERINSTEGLIWKLSKDSPIDVEGISNIVQDAIDQHERGLQPG